MRADNSVGADIASIHLTSKKQILQFRKKKKKFDYFRQLDTFRQKSRTYANCVKNKKMCTSQDLSPKFQEFVTQ